MKLNMKCIKITQRDMARQMTYFKITYNVARFLYDSWASYFVCAYTITAERNERNKLAFKGPGALRLRLLHICDAAA